MTSAYEDEEVDGSIIELDVGEIGESIVFDREQWDAVFDQVAAKPFGYWELRFRCPNGILMKEIAFAVRYGYGWQGFADLVLHLSRRLLDIAKKKHEALHCEICPVGAALLVTAIRTPLMANNWSYPDPRLVRCAYEQSRGYDWGHIGHQQLYILGEEIRHGDLTGEEIQRYYFDISQHGIIGLPTQAGKSRLFGEWWIHDQITNQDYEEGIAGLDQWYEAYQGFIVQDMAELHAALALGFGQPAPEVKPSTDTELRRHGESDILGNIVVFDGEETVKALYDTAQRDLKTVHEVWSVIDTAMRRHQAMLGYSLSEAERFLASVVRTMGFTGKGVADVMRWHRLQRYLRVTTPQSPKIMEELHRRHHVRLKELGFIEVGALLLVPLYLLWRIPETFNIRYCDTLQYSIEERSATIDSITDEEQSAFSSKSC